ncbi:hypothetical protein FRB95_011956 [Tulasnella sp. JGI-2019a]|nr:hypothetical protein FRB95_011956 [Tulasnella sp. JGI-2019a]
MNTHTLASLLCLDHSNSGDFTDSMRTKVLGYLQAVLIVPDVDDENPSRDAKPIRFIHKSFQDYLTDKSRCNVRFLINIAEERRRMAIRCLRRMEDLQKPNICDIDPTTLTQTDVRRYNMKWELKAEVTAEVKDLVRRHISSALQYSCENWAIYVSRASPECDNVCASVDMFVRNRLLYWLEVLSLLGMTNKVVGLVELVEVWLKARPHQVLPNSSELPTPTLLSRIATSITDGLVKTQARIRLQTDLIQMTSGPLSRRALDHVKRFLADFLPIPQPTVSFQASTLLAESNISTPSLLQDFKNLIAGFEVPIRTSAPHIYYSALPFTPSHTSLSQVYGHLAEGGPKPRRGCLQQWSRQTAHPCVAWSPDGQKVISESEDGTLCLWDLSTGERVGETSEFLTRGVKCAAWSLTGKKIVPGSLDDTLQLWDSTFAVRIGEAEEDHIFIVASLAWYPGGKRFASGSVDKSFRTPTIGGPVGDAWEYGDRVRCVTSDGKEIASGIGRGAGIQFWDPSTGVVVGEFPEEIHTYPFGFAWSPDGKRIVSVNLGKNHRSWNVNVYNTLTLWDTYTGEPIGNPWKGHTGSVLSVAWSPDGKRIVSGSKDRTLRLWDASTGTPIGNAWQGLIGDVKTLAWSPDGNTIISGSENGAPMLWRSETGDPIRLGQRWSDGHSCHVYRLAFPPNSDRIVTASSDGTLRLWDTSSGVLVGHLVLKEPGSPV